MPENRTRRTACSRARNTTSRGTRDHIIFGSVHTVSSSFGLFYTFIDIPLPDLSPHTAKMLVVRQHRPLTRTREDPECDRDNYRTA